MDVLIYMVSTPENFSVHVKWLFSKSDPLVKTHVAGIPTWCCPRNFSVQESQPAVGWLEEGAKIYQVLSIQANWIGWTMPNHGVGSQKPKMA